MSPLNIGAAGRALLAQQQAMDIISRNIANVNTPGYVRQEAVLVSTTDGGVRVENVRRYVDNFLIGQVRRNSTARSQWDVRQNALQYIQVTIQEPSDQGLNATLNDFWTAWQDLAAAPNSPSVRTNLREVSRRLTNQMNNQVRQLTALQKDLDYRVSTQVQEVNSIATQIGRLNATISESAASGTDGNDLRDQRDRLVDRLSELVNINYAEDSFGPGTMSINIGNQPLVTGANVSKLITLAGNGNRSNVAWADGTAVEMTGGEIVGAVEARDVLIPQELAQLDAVASTLITRVNALHQDGFGLNDATGLDFFAGTGAGNIRISNAINADISNIAAAATAGSPGDGDTALAITDLQRSLLMNSGTATIGGFYAEFVAQLGLDAREAKSSFDERDLLYQHLNQQRDSVSGVSLDEEAVHLMEAQRAYQAAARVVSIIDQIMAETIMTMGR
jgi:flagellar hook-associated protein 1 FlgK